MRSLKFFTVLVFCILFIQFLIVPFSPSSYAAVNPYQEATVSLTFDDATADQYVLAAPILKEKGLKATEYVVTGDVGKTGSMTWQQITDLQNTYGWEIGSHSVTHPELTKVSATKLTTEVQQSRTDLINHGFNPTTFATPYGDYNNKVIAAIAKSYRVHRGFWDRDNLNIWPYNQYLITVQSVETTTTVAQVKTWIDTAIANKQWLVLVFHQIVTGTKNDDYQTTTADLQQILDYINTTGIKNTLVKDMFPSIGANLLVNPGFEQGLSVGWTTDKSTNVKLNTANNGSYPEPTNSIAFSGTNSAIHLFSPKIPIAENAFYLIRGFMNTSSLTKGEVGFYVDEYDASNNWISGKRLGGYRVKDVFEAGFSYTPTSANVKNAVLQIYMNAGSGGTVYVDSFEWYLINSYGPTPTTTPIPSVTPTDIPTPTPTVPITPTPTVPVTPTPTPTVTNPVANPSFENVTGGWALNWRRDNSSFILLDALSNGNDGLNSAHFVTGNTSEAHLFSDNISVDATKTYTWNTFIKGNVGSSTGEFGFYIDEYDASNNWISGQWKQKLPVGAINGITSINYKPTSSNVKQIGLQYYQLINSPIDLYIDSVQLIQN